MSLYGAVDDGWAYTRSAPSCGVERHKRHQIDLSALFCIHITNEKQRRIDVADCIMLQLERGQGPVRPLRGFTRSPAPLWTFGVPHVMRPMEVSRSYSVHSRPSPPDCFRCYSNREACEENLYSYCTPRHLGGPENTMETTVPPQRPMWDVQCEGKLLCTLRQFFNAYWWCLLSPCSRADTGNYVRSWLVQWCIRQLYFMPIGRLLYCHRAVTFSRMDRRISAVIVLQHLDAVKPHHNWRCDVGLREKIDQV